jgi:hypothetical protein
MSGVKSHEEKLADPINDRINNQYCPVTTPLVSEASKPIVDLLVLSRTRFYSAESRHHNRTRNSPLTKSDLIAPLTKVAKDAKVVDTSVCTCSHCCLDLHYGEKDDDDDKKQKTHIRLKEVSRCKSSPWSNSPCVYCQKPATLVNFSLPQKNAAVWARIPVCQECSDAGKIPSYRLHHLFRCTKCNTDSMSVVGGRANQIVWEAFTCECESVRHLIYSGLGGYGDLHFGVHIDKEIDMPHFYWHFECDECVLK